jgi:hypothetical protein
MSNYNQLKEVLNDIFELNKADLDFGIYRIMNQKRKQVNEFIEKQLPEDIKKALSDTQSSDKTEIENELKTLKKNLDDAGIVAEDTPKYKSLSERLKTIGNSDSLEQEVFSHLTNFFRRYYKDGDFISMRRYKKDVYAIPYEGEEVKHPDTMLAYSPEKKAMEAFYLQFDHGTVYNFAREFFRLKAITKDSMVLQRLQVDGKIIANDDDIRSDVYCTFYSKNYIENVLKTTIGELQKPSKADSLFIRSLSAKTNNAPSNPDLAFAARQPVQFLPNSKNVSVEKISTVDAVNKRHSSVDYLYPLYKLKINKSYKNFNYSFSVIVDAWGKMYVNRVDGVMRNDYPPRKRLLQGITDVYLQNLFIIKPGTTLGIPHGCEVSLILIGKTNP